MAALYVTALRTLQAEGPYRLGGWSMGGVVAFEMARQLAAQGEVVDLLALFDAAAPSGRPSKRPNPVAMVRAFARELEIMAPGKLRLPPGTNPDLDERKVLTLLLDQARTESLVVGDLDLAAFMELYQTYRTNLDAMQNYTVKPYAGGLHLFRAESTASRFSADPTLGWAPWVLGGLKVLTSPGDHYSIVRRPQVRHVATSLAVLLKDN
jgi:thioesterase domain-containing protein